MIDIFFILVGIVYSVAVLLLLAFGLNFYYLTYVSLKAKTMPRPEAPQTWPRVTVQLPVYNELYVVERLVEAAANLDYPRDSLEIQVLDDSTDETSQLVRRAVESISARGIDIVHLHRSERIGYKAGALAAGMARAKGEFLAIFDADFVPGPDFLRTTIPSFEDPKIAFLQTRWSHLNRDYSLLTRLQSLFIDAHFIIEQTARSRAGYWFNFNGTAGVWRKAAIVDAGGWKADTLTEDMDLSYRVFLAGWRAAYLRDVSVPAELPVTMTSFRRQQYRWARGSLEVAQRHLPRVFHAPISLKQKLEAGLHLTGYCLHLLLFTVSLLYPLVLAMSLRYPNLMPVFRAAAVFNLGVFAQTVFLLSAQQQLKRPWWKMLPSILFVSALGAGMMLNTVRAALDIFTKKQVGFQRTPKYGIGRKEHGWKHKRYQLRLDQIVFWELLFAGFNGWTIYFALRHQNWIMALYAIINCAGLLLTSALSVQQMLSLSFQRAQRLTPASEPVSVTASTLETAQPSLALTGARAGRPVPVEFDHRENVRQAVEKTIAYSDVFDYPLTADEISRFLIGTPVTRDVVQSVLDELCAGQQLVFADGFYALPERESIISIRKRRQLVAHRLWQRAAYFGGLISRLPFIRMVSVTGSLAMDNVEPGADIDYLIVTEPDRLWLCRALVVILVRWAGMQGVTLCPNYMLSERALVFPDRSVYTAHELAQMIPLYGLDIYTRMLQLNRWTEQFLPNAVTPVELRLLPVPGPGYQRIRSRVERLLRTPLGTRIERWEMARKIRKLRAIEVNSQESGFGADWCKGHFHHHAQNTLDSYEQRLASLGTESVSKETI